MAEEFKPVPETRDQILKRKLLMVHSLLKKYEKEPRVPEEKIPIRLEKDGAVSTALKWLEDSINLIDEDGQQTDSK